MNLILDNGLWNGSNCPVKDCKGVLVIYRSDTCSCHIHPPCSACVDATVECNECGYSSDDEEQTK